MIPADLPTPQPLDGVRGLAGPCGDRVEVERPGRGDGICDRGCNVVPSEPGLGTGAIEALRERRVIRT